MRRKIRIGVLMAFIAAGSCLLAQAADQAAPRKPTVSELATLDRLPKLKAKIEAGEPVTIIGLGDSITTYFGNNSRNCGYYPVPVDVSYYGVFANFLKMSFPDAKIKVINKGIGGETADRGLKRLDSDVLSLKPDLVFVMYGANDGRGGRDMQLFKKELTEIVSRIRTAGSDVILVAPTMSLTDLACLLPCREAVLSLRKTLDCPVLDGTLALWPIDEKVSSLDDVSWYLSMHFPPNGDDIHPAFAGQFQMGRRLWNQLKAPVQMPKLDFSLTRGQKLTGPVPHKLRITNVSDKAFSGQAEVFFPNKMPVAGVPSKEIVLPNKAKENRRSLPAVKLELAPDAAAEIEWNMELPEAEGFLQDPSLLSWLDGKSGVGVAIFSRELNDLAYVKPGPPLLSARIEGPRRVDDITSVRLSAKFSSLSEKNFDGAWRRIGDKEWKALSIPASSSAEGHFDMSFNADSGKTVLLRQGLELRDSKGATIALDAVMIEAAPCVDTVAKDIAVDGGFDDWTGVSWCSFNAGAAKASFAVARSGDNLLLALRADDPLLEFQRSPIWFGDGFELYFDARPEAELGTHGSLFQIGLFPPKSPGSPLIVSAGNGAGASDLSSIKTAWRTTDSGYAIELSMPVGLFAPAGMKEGQVIGFGVACNNVAEAGQPRIQYQWAGTNGNYASPANYAFLRWGPGAPLWSLRYQR
ncbi:MAG: GDSL-type esterase/lipase family protein [Victivallales bacterium]